MKRFIPNLRKQSVIPLVMLAVVLLVYPQTAEAGLFSWALGSVADVAGWIAVSVLQIVSAITYLSGTILNFVIKYTIVEMALRLEGSGIEDTWRLIRDVANMGFIFILLYSAIQTVLGIGSNNQKIIVNVVIAAILINFSLFITMVVIDAANVLALLFYGTMVPASALTPGGEFINSGLANSIMDPLKISSIWQAKGSLDGTQLLIIGVLGSVVALIAAFVFLAISIMLIIRFVALLFVLVLSPIAFVASTMPALKKYRDMWQEALIGQAFFAPIYFMLTWIVIKVSRSLPTASGDMKSAIAGAVKNSGGNVVVTHDPKSVALLVNFAIIITLLIATLTISKKTADRAGSQVSGLTKWATSKGGGVAFGTMGWAGRTSFGSLGRMSADSASLQTAANKERTWRPKDVAAGAAARLALYASQKARSATFDPRNASVPTGMVGDAIQGTVGRTGFGRALGLDDVNLPVFGAGESIKVGEFAASQTGVGRGQEGGYKERKEESDKRVEQREAAARKEWREVEQKNKVMGGIDAAPGTPEYDAIEKAIANMSDKEVEAIVESNRELLKSQAFANSISVRQLEALNKSDKFSETEKDDLKAQRFSSINAAMALGTPAAISGISDDIKDLADAELEMLDPEYLKNVNFVAEMKSGQIESVNKSGRFTQSQKSALKKTRLEPLITDLTSGNIVNAQAKVKKMGPKDLIGLMKQPVPGRPNAGLDPIVLPTYTPQMLTRMAQDMNTSDIQTLRAALLTGGNPNTITWLNDPDAGVRVFS